MFSISFPAKSKHAHPIATHVEVASTPSPFSVLLWSAVVAGLLVLIILTSDISFPQAKTDRRFWHAMSDTVQDDQAHVMGKVLSGDAAAADVVMLGTSSAREALRLDREFNAQLKQQHGSSITTINLSSGAQSPIEVLLIAEAIQPREGQLFILFISLSSLKQPKPFEAIEHGKFMYPPGELIEKYSHRKIFPGYWQNTKNRLIYFARAKREDLYRRLNYRLKYWIGEHVYGETRPAYLPHLNVGRPPLEPAVKKRQIASFKTDASRYLNSNAAYVANTLAVLSEYLSNRKCRFIIALPPEIKNEMHDLFPDEFRVFTEILDTLQKTHLVERVNLNDSMKWEAGDFRDLTHVNESGRIKWSTALAAWLARQPFGKTP